MHKGHELPESTERVGRGSWSAEAMPCSGRWRFPSSWSLEVKSVDALAPVHEAQLPTYLRLSGRLGFLIDFNVVLLKQDVKRMIL